MVIVTGKRLRSRYFRTASMNIRKIKDLGMLKREDFEVVGKSFDSWLEEYGSGKVCVLAKDSEYCFVRQICRFQKAYKNQIWHKLKHLQKVVFVHHLVLEINPHGFLRYVNEYDWINKSWARLRAWLFKRYGKFQFLRVLEPHKSLRPHLHVLIAGVPFIDYVALKREWSVRLGCGYVFRKTVRSGFNILWYVLKYVCKMVKDDGKKKFDRLFSAVLFAMNKRLFSLSRSLRLTTEKVVREKIGYVYLGSRPLVLLENFCCEKGLKFKMVLKVTVDYADLWGHQELFFVDEDLKAKRYSSIGDGEVSAGLGV